MIDELRGYVARSGGSETVVECRRCGTSLDANAETCEECGSDEIVAYEL
jgi:ribosomal protein L37E